MAIETGTISVTGGTVKGYDHFDDVEDTQYVTLTDGGSFTYLKLSNFGKGSATEDDEGPGGDDEFYLNLREFDDDFNIELASLDEGDTLFFDMVDSYSVESDLEHDVLVYTINYTGSDGESHTVEVDLFSPQLEDFVGIDITLACFAKGTLIETYHGPCAVEDLDTGDKVLCGDGVFRLVRWIAARKVTAPELDACPQFRPIRIRHGSLGQNLPDRDLVVSPQHKILISDWRAELMFGSDEVLIPAKFLINDTTITSDFSAAQVTYYHFMLDSHQTVLSNGVESESFHPGDMALTGVEDEARKELFALFPQLEVDPESFGPTYLPSLKAYEANALFATNHTARRAKGCAQL